MTSHELRNPLSAVVQSADSIISTLQGLPVDALCSSSLDKEFPKMKEDLKTSIEGLQTIVSCSLHQKRVIDDVLTLSKLDPSLILITPIPVQPAVVVLEAIKMFDLECNQMGIKLDFSEDEVCKDYDWVMLDPSRLIQILINLLYVYLALQAHDLTFQRTNAIKFTKDCNERMISVRLGSSLKHPPDLRQAVRFMAEDDTKIDLLQRAEWGTGERIYIWLSVTDTGCGMTEDEQKKLFSRFSQATPRTHVKYGGSGLGLFISKSLASLQGGAIGVSSHANVGSTFAFYISARHAERSSSQRGQSRLGPLQVISCEEAMKAASLNVLIVEDNVVNQKVLKKQLAKFGWNVSVAGDGNKALEWLKRSSYWQGDEPLENNAGTGDGSTNSLDVILMDIEMPIMDGLTCTRTIREYESNGLLGLPQNPKTSSENFPRPPGTPLKSIHHRHASPLLTQKIKSRIPILGVSANARMEQINEAIEAGMDDTISKPFRIPDLWSKLCGILPKLQLASVMEQGEQRT